MRLKKIRIGLPLYSRDAVIRLRNCRIVAATDTAYARSKNVQSSTIIGSTFLFQSRASLVAPVEVSLVYKECVPAAPCSCFEFSNGAVSWACALHARTLTHTARCDPVVF